MTIKPTRRIRRKLRYLYKSFIQMREPNELTRFLKWLHRIVGTALDKDVSETEYLESKLMLDYRDRIQLKEQNGYDYISRELWSRLYREYRSIKRLANDIRNNHSDKSIEVGFYISLDYVDGINYVRRKQIVHSILVDKKAIEKLVEEVRSARRRRD